MTGKLGRTESCVPGETVAWSAFLAGIRNNGGQADRAEQ